MLNFLHRKDKKKLAPPAAEEYKAPSSNGRPKALSDIDIGKILAWKEDGLTNCRIAERLHVSEGTVRRYLKNATTYTNA